MKMAMHSLHTLQDLGVGGGVRMGGRWGGWYLVGEILSTPPPL